MYKPIFVNTARTYASGIAASAAMVIKKLLGMGGIPKAPEGEIHSRNRGRYSNKRMTDLHNNVKGTKWSFVSLQPDGRGIFRCRQEPSITREFNVKIKP